MWSRLALASWLSVVLGCGSDGDRDRGDASASDGGVVVDAGSPALPPELPSIPWWTPDAIDAAPPVALPDLGCAESGWRAVPAYGIDVCEPWPETGHATCAGAEAHFAGEAGCARVGSACPAGAFPEALPADRPVVHVQPGATGGDGTAARPYATIAEAIAAAPSGAVVALARGTHATDGVDVPGGVTLWGACVAETVLTSSAPAPSGSVRGVVHLAGDAELRNLRIADASLPGVVAASGTVRIEDVVIERTASAGVVALATVTARALVIRDVTAAAGTTLRRGIDARSGANVSIERGLVERTAEVGIAAAASSTVALTDFAIVGSRGLGIDLRGGALNATDLVVDTAAGDAMNVDQRATARLERAIARGGLIAVQNASSLTASRLRVVEPVPFGIAALGTGATLSLTDVVVTDTAYAASAGAAAIAFAMGASATGARVLVAANDGHGIVAFGPGTMGTLEDVTAIETRFAAIGTEGLGIAATDYAQLVVRRVRAEASTVAGLYAARNGILTAEDALAAGARTRPGAWAHGALAQDGGQVGLVRAVMRDNEGFGAVAERGSALYADDFVAEGTFAAGEWTGMGVALTVEAQAAGMRWWLKENEGAGLAILRGSIVTLGDVSIEGTRPDAFGFGFGVAAGYGGRSAITRLRVTGSHMAGVIAHNGSEIGLADARIEDSLPPACDPALCSPAPPGVGAGAYWGGAIYMTAFVIDRSAVCGVHLGPDSSLDLIDGVVSRSEIGACVQADPYDLERLSMNVVYVDNTTTLQTTTLPLPEALAAEPTPGM